MSQENIVEQKIPPAPILTFQNLWNFPFLVQNAQDFLDILRDQKPDPIILHEQLALALKDKGLFDLERARLVVGDIAQGKIISYTPPHISKKNDLQRAIEAFGGNAYAIYDAAIKARQLAETPKFSLLLNFPFVSKHALNIAENLYSSHQILTTGHLALALMKHEGFNSIQAQNVVGDFVQGNIVVQGTYNVSSSISSIVKLAGLKTKIEFRQLIAAAKLSFHEIGLPSSGGGKFWSPTVYRELWDLSRHGLSRPKIISILSKKHRRPISPIILQGRLADLNTGRIDPGQDPSEFVQLDVVALDIKERDFQKPQTSKQVFWSLERKREVWDLYQKNLSDNKIVSIFREKHGRNIAPDGINSMISQLKSGKILMAEKPSQFSTFDPSVFGLSEKDFRKKALGLTRRDVSLKTINDAPDVNRLEKGTSPTKISSKKLVS